MQQTQLELMPTLRKALQELLQDKMPTQAALVRPKWPETYIVFAASASLHSYSANSAWVGSFILAVSFDMPPQELLQHKTPTHVKLVGFEQPKMHEVLLRE